MTSFPTEVSLPTLNLPSDRSIVNITTLPLVPPMQINVDKSQSSPLYLEAVDKHQETKPS